MSNAASTPKAPPRAIEGAPMTVHALIEFIYWQQLSQPADTRYGI